MRWLITGGCGFIGSALVKRLISDGSHTIRIIDNLSVGTKDDLYSVTQFLEIEREQLCKEIMAPVELIVGDILDDALATLASVGCDIVVHLAANTGVGPSVEDPRKDMLANIVGTFNYLCAAKEAKVSRFIFASSGAPIGEVIPPIHEELAPHPVSPYGASKLAGEGYCSAFKGSYDLDTVVLRFGNVYGPGSIHKSSVVAKFTQRAIAGEILEIYGDGTQTRDFIFIDDLIAAILLAATVPSIGGETFQIASSQETTVSEMVSSLVDSLKHAGVQNIKLMNAEIRIGDVKRNFSDTSKARNRMGWQPKVNLDEGLRKTISYFLKK